MYIAVFPRILVCVLLVSCPAKRLNRKWLLALNSVEVHVGITKAFSFDSDIARYLPPTPSAL